ncbi:MAG: GntR family transcriptional regulator [Kiritimatiellae bacterium]|jgi:mannose-6-phosphate isomerase|nr:GntR family transcriptional regulator [Kiritimatiellia bacterium]
MINKTQYVRDKIFREILEGKYKPGGKLPTEVQMAKLTNTSRITIRRAFAELEKSGIIHRIQGRGTFVSISLHGGGGEGDHVALLTTLNDPFALEFITHLESELAKQDLLLTLKITDEDPRKENAAAIKLVAKGIRNLIVWPSGNSVSYDTFFRLRVLGANIVFFDRKFPGDCADYIGLDHKKAVTDLLEHACCNGLKEFIFINYKGLVADSNAMRQEAFEKYCADKKLKHSVVLIDYSSSPGQQIEANWKNWIHGFGKLAVICVNDTVSIAASDVLGNKINIYGIDGFSKAIERGIVSVAQPLSMMAVKSIQLLQKQRELGSNWKARNIFVKGKIIEKKRENIMNFNQPILFMPNRVWRAYVGGQVMDEFLYGLEKPDGHFPEDWLGSVTIANNYVNQQSPEEGLTRVRNSNGKEGPLFKDLLEKYPQQIVGNDSGNLDVLCKYLDSAIRLPIQCHPDKEFALKYLDSPNGKTESWFVLATRQINGEDPYLLLGFKENVDADDFKKAVLAQDILTMENSLHKIKVKPGDMYFIPGRLPHAIGPGVFLLEVQEPTDWVVQPELYIGDTKLSHQEMWGELSIEDGLKCFDYESKGTLEQILRRCRLLPATAVQNENYIFSEIIGPAITDCFAVHKMEINKSCGIKFNNWAISVVTEGVARINNIEVKRGDYFFVPYAAEEVKFDVEQKVSIYVIGNQSLSIR